MEILFLSSVKTLPLRTRFEDKGYLMDDINWYILSFDSVGALLTPAYNYFDGRVNFPGFESFI